MFLKKFIMLSIMVLVSSVSYALESTKLVEVKSIDLVSKKRPAQPGAEGLIFVHIDPVDWVTADCRSNVVTIYSTDTHLLSILLSRVSMGKTAFNFTVDDELKPYSTMCPVVKINVNI